MALLANLFSLSLALLLGLASLFVHGVSSDPTPVATRLMLAAFALVGFGLYVVFRRDPARATLFGIAASVLVGILGSAIVVSTDDPQVLSRWITLSSFGCAFALIGYLIRTGNVSDTIPNILLTRTDRDEIRESNDVQWFGMQTTKTLELATTVEIIFQNCVDAARMVRLRLVEVGAPSNRSKRVTCPEGVSAELMPSEVARVVVPIRAVHGASGDVELEIRVDVSGKPGLRTRRFRAKQAESPLADLLRNVPFLQSTRKQWTGSGSLFTFQIRPRSGAPRNSSAPPIERWERLWTPLGGASTRPPSPDLLFPDGMPLGQKGQRAIKASPDSFHPSAPISPSSLAPRSISVPAQQVSASSRPPQSYATPSQPPPSRSLTPGSRVRVHRGNSVRPAKIVEVDSIRVRCEFEDGQQVWVMPSQVDD